MYISLNKTITFFFINYSKAYEVKVLGEEFRTEESRRVFSRRNLTSSRLIIRARQIGTVQSSLYVDRLQARLGELAPVTKAGPVPPYLYCTERKGLD